MTPRKPSPLAPLVQLRDERARGAALALSEAAALEASARAKLEARRADEASLGRAHSVVKQGERAGLEAGALRAGDLQQGGLWALEAQAAKARAEAVAREAERARDGAAAAVTAARAEVARRRAEADAAAQLLARAQAKDAAREQATLEEAAEEAFASRWKHPCSPATLAQGNEQPEMQRERRQDMQREIDRDGPGNRQAQRRGAG